jgi:DNA-binding Lrp family transcriptional regulator
MIDEINEKILSLLENNSRMTYVEIGLEVGLSEGAVRNRVLSLTENGIIKKFTIEKEYEIGIRALTMIAVNPIVPTYDISKIIDKMIGVEHIYEVTGEYDIIIVLNASNMSGINELIEEIRKINGVVKTNTIIVLKSLK